MKMLSGASLHLQDILFIHFLFKVDEIVTCHNPLFSIKINISISNIINSISISFNISISINIKISIGIEQAHKRGLNMKEMND